MYVAHQQNLVLLWNQKSHYDFYKNALFDPTLSQLNPVHIFTPCFLRTHFDTCILRSFKWSLTLLLFMYFIILYNYAFEALNVCLGLFYILHQGSATISLLQVMLAIHTFVEGHRKNNGLDNE
jgi:hypothetical protein